MVKFSGKSRNILKLFNTCILKIWMVSDKTIHMACRIHKTLWTGEKKPLEKFPFFTINQNYTLALNWHVWCIRPCLFMSAVENDKRSQECSLTQLVTDQFLWSFVTPTLCKVCFIRVLFSLSMNPLCPTSMASYLLCHRLFHSNPVLMPCTCRSFFCEHLWCCSRRGTVSLGSSHTITTIHAYWKWQCCNVINSKFVLQSFFILIKACTHLSNHGECI